MSKKRMKKLRQRIQQLTITDPVLLLTQGHKIVSDAKPFDPHTSVLSTDGPHMDRVKAATIVGNNKEVSRGRMYWIFRDYSRY